MGEGVANALGLIVDLCIAKNKVFLIEEPENDIHPTALKGLLDLVAVKAATNQFIITTHSNIVVKHLGSQPESKLFDVDMILDADGLPTASVTEVGETVEDRRTVLESLGYELHHVDLWDYWLFLEESSAEKIIRTYLIPWFAPSLRLLVS